MGSGTQGGPGVGGPLHDGTPMQAGSSGGSLVSLTRWGGNVQKRHWDLLEWFGIDMLCPTECTAQEHRKV